MTNVVPFRKLYEAKMFSAQTEFGAFVASGTLCGHIDFVVPCGHGKRRRVTFPLNPYEAQGIALALKRAVEDVLEHSEPLTDPRLEDA